MCGILWLNFSLIIGPYFLSIFRPCRYRIGSEDFAVKLYILTLNTSGILRLCDNLSYKFKYVEVIKFLFKIIFYKILRSKKVNAIVFYVKHHSDVKIHFCTNKWTKVLLDRSPGGQHLTLYKLKIFNNSAHLQASNLLFGKRQQLPVEAGHASLYHPFLLCKTHTNNTNVY